MSERKQMISSPPFRTQMMHSIIHVKTRLGPIFFFFQKLKGMFLVKPILIPFFSFTRGLLVKPISIFITHDVPEGLEVCLSYFPVNMKS